jgi:glycerol-3-phosphate dehydrogenase
VVPRLYAGDRCYMFQNPDRRILFVIPYEDDFTLIGTTDRDYRGDPAKVSTTAEEIAYLCAAANEYLRRPVAPDEVVWSYAGVRPLFDDGAAEARTATRDYVLHLDAPDGQPAALSVIGGKITTYRRLAEAALARLAPHLPPPAGAAAGWTAETPLPGGDFAPDGVSLQLRALKARYPFLADATARRLVHAYGTLAPAVLGDATAPADLGRDFGAGLTEAEVRHLVRREWAASAADVLWRRSKLGLRLSTDEATTLDVFVATLASEPQQAREGTEP